MLDQEDDADIVKAPSDEMDERSNTMFLQLVDVEPLGCPYQICGQLSDLDVSGCQEEIYKEVTRLYEFYNNALKE